MKIFALATLVAIGCAAMSEHWSGSLSIAKDYFFSDLDSQTNGTVIESNLEQKKSRYSVISVHNIVYEYSVYGVGYKSSRVDYETKKTEASKKVERYPVGKSVIVFYDSKKPYYSSLEKGPLGSGVVIQLSVILFMFFFILLLGSSPRGYFGKVIFFIVCELEDKTIRFIRRVFFRAFKKKK